MAVNVKGAVHCLKSALPLMRARGSGAVVNISSISAFVGQEAFAPYAVSKAAVSQLTRNVAADVGKDGIRVNAVCPGFMESRTSVVVGPAVVKMDDLVARHPIGRLGKPVDIAKAIAFLASDDAAFITGHSLVVDGGYTAV